MDFTFVITFVSFCCLKGVSSQNMYCNFEDSNICGFTQSSSDTFNWTRHSGSTGSSSTGPTDDLTFRTAAGHYMYIEASGPRTAGDNASLISPSQSPTTGACLQFGYHMYGVNIGTLHVRMHQGGQITNTIFTKTGNIGNFWNQAGITVRSSSSSWQLDFQGITGADFQSDIAIDDVSITPGPCGGCTFEDGICGWTNVGGDNFNWLRGFGSTSSVFTGPVTDHTRADPKGAYMHMSSSPRGKTGDKGWFVSPTFPAFTTSESRCFSFWFHMYGADIGTLNVYVVDTSGTNPALLWSQSGNKGKHWIHSQMPIPVQSQDYKIRFEGEKGVNGQDEIALDDISVTSSAQCEYTDCSPGKYGSQCTFSCRSTNCRNNQCDRSSGLCTECPDNFIGNTCSDCSPGKYGPQCTASCISANCRNNQCDRSTGLCDACPDNFDGNTCSDCSPGKYGPKCTASCMSAKCRNNQCDRYTGFCDACPDNFDGNTCSDCSPGKYGPQCTSQCFSANCRNNQCDRSTGRCRACTDNFTGTSCFDCSPGKYGPQCTSSCRSANCRNNQCDRSTGYCATCPDNFTGNTCSECAPGKFSSDCSSSCLSSNCLNNECNATTRLCNACPDFFQGDLCSDCVSGRYGSDCRSPCLSSTCANNQCNRTTGLCDVCLDNLDGGLCSALPSSHDWTLTIAGAAVGVGVLVIICVIVCICCLRRSRGKRETTEATAPPIPLIEMEPAPELRSPPPRAVEGAGAEADDPDSVYEKIRISCIGAEHNTYSEFTPQQAEAIEPESLYVNVDFS